MSHYSHQNEIDLDEDVRLVQKDLKRNYSRRQLLILAYYYDISPYLNTEQLTFRIAKANLDNIHLASMPSNRETNKRVLASAQEKLRRVNKNIHQLYSDLERKLDSEPREFKTLLDEVCGDALEKLDNCSSKSLNHLQKGEVFLGSPRVKRRVHKEPLKEERKTHRHPRKVPAPRHKEHKLSIFNRQKLPSQRESQKPKLPELPLPRQRKKPIRKIPELPLPKQRKSEEVDRQLFSKTPQMEPVSLSKAPLRPPQKEEPKTSSVSVLSFLSQEKSQPSNAVCQSDNDCERARREGKLNDIYPKQKVICVRKRDGSSDCVYEA